MGSRSAVSRRSQIEIQFVEFLLPCLYVAHHTTNRHVGNLDWSISCLAYMPLKAVEAILFAQQKITLDLLFDGEEFRFIHFVSAHGYGDNSVIYEVFNESQLLLISGMKQLFRDKVESGESSDSDFLTDFVEFCTGQSYLPDLDCNTDYKITVEFNSDENEIGENHLPVAHTCINTLKLPGAAYNGNMEDFERYLSIALETSKGVFGMN
jgi:HECT-domain (ubiquitin-transferase)